MASEPSPPDAPPPGRRANNLDGAEWTRCSISVWSDIRKTAEEAALKHPAMFPTELVRRVIRCFTRECSRHVLDPFCGSGSTLVAAHAEGGRGTGFEVSPDYVELAHRRMASLPGADYALHAESAERVPERLAADSVDLCVTSPPYWDILAQRRTADQKVVRDYAGADEDLSRVEDYGEFVERLARAFEGVHRVLKPGGYCVVNVMDLRKKATFYPLHSDLAARLSAPHGPFIYDDLIIWDRRADYNNFRPLGYPYVFRINKAHEFLVVLRKAA